MIEGKWNELKGRAREKWGKETEDDLDAAKGHKGQLAGLKMKPMFFVFVTDFNLKRIKDGGKKMKRWLVFFGVVCLAMGGMGLINSCGGENETNMEEVREDTQKALQSAADWTEERAEEIYAQVKSGVEDLRKELRGLQAKMPEQEEAEKEWEQRISDLENQIDNLEQDVAELQDKSGEAWKKAKNEIEQSIEEIKEDINKLREK